MVLAGGECADSVHAWSCVGPLAHDDSVLWDLQHKSQRMLACLHHVGSGLGDGAGRSRVWAAGAIPRLGSYVLVRQLMHKHTWVERHRSSSLAVLLDGWGKRWLKLAANHRSGA